MTTQGVYLLIIRLPKPCAAPKGIDSNTLPAGWYAYAGSAMGGLEARLARHLRTTAVRHWHVDHLLAYGKIVDIQVLLTTDSGEECRLAEHIRSWPGGEVVAGFGSSDCRCASHLSRFPRRPSGSVLAHAVLPALPEMYCGLRGHYEDHSRFERDPFRTLVSCILSLRTQDPVTDAASGRLFEVLRTPRRRRDATTRVMLKTGTPKTRIGVNQETSRGSPTGT